jgi:uncharacterized protein YdbL (DUF1318 family)
MKKFAAFVCAVACIGCAKVSIETAKPIKLDISMRLDVYQHAVKEAASIEDQIYGKSAPKSLSFDVLMASAYAEDGVDGAIAGRKARAEKVEAFFASGEIGENRLALLVALSGASAEAKQIVAAENADREIIYQATAAKMGISMDEMRKIFYDDQKKRAPAGSNFDA